MKKILFDPQELYASELRENIIKTFKKFGDNLTVLNWELLGARIRFKIKLKGKTRKASILAHAPEVQSRLQLSLFQVDENGIDIYIVASDQELRYSSLLDLLNDYTFNKALRKMKLPYIVGHDIIGQPLLIDLATCPHLLLGGSTNSGKTVGLQALITTIIHRNLPTTANLILIDIGARGLAIFEGIPHLACPIVQDFDTAYRTLTALKSEMERRIEIEYTDSKDFKRLPSLVLVVDELPALFSGASSKGASKQVAGILSSLLQRGRHAKIHLVLAAQNPTYQNIKIDLGNITTRIAFQCAKENFSKTILGEGGAENLRNQGSLFLKSPQHDSLKWVQGIYIKPKEIRLVTQHLKSSQYLYDMDKKFNLAVPAAPLIADGGDLFSRLQPITTVSGPSEQNQLFAAVLFWAFGRDHISTNTLMLEHHIGWNRASDLVKQMEELKIVDALDGKRARRVRPKSIEDLSDGLIRFMECCDYPRDSLLHVFQERAEKAQIDDISTANSLEICSAAEKEQPLLFQ